ncbi:hypothetical protein MIND_00792600 [Mycena indigotica]|uniref:Uncharacterized protein n=1 Tax=Mycena indigotica TaxID=2126181 RepID=A0A8H6SMS5_9AGAR|nr:uncharacterized protein MIND_00792600 [Mycena indigotica]KAF7302256.1 hypothetical protein MIND_00792600 [Mycena indigotica]
MPSTPIFDPFSPDPCSESYIPVVDGGLESLGASKWRLLFQGRGQSTPDLAPGWMGSPKKTQAPSNQTAQLKKRHVNAQDVHIGLPPKVPMDLEDSVLRPSPQPGPRAPKSKRSSWSRFKRN